MDRIPAEAGQTLDKFLAAPDRLGSRSKAATARERGKVFVNEGEAGPRDIRLRLKAGDEIRVWEDRPAARGAGRRPFTSGPLRILYEDQHLIVLNKPAGPARCAAGAARARKHRYSIRLKTTCGRMASASRWSFIESIATRRASCCSRKTDTRTPR